MKVKIIDTSYLVAIYSSIDPEIPDDNNGMVMVSKPKVHL